MTIKTAIEMREAAAWELDRDISCHAPNTDGKRELLIEYRDRIRALPVASPPPDAERVWKSGGKYGGPGVVVSRWKDEQGGDMVTVAHKIEGGYGTFKHIYPAKIIEPLEQPAPTPPDDARQLALAVEALRSVMECFRGAPYMSGETVWSVAHGSHLNDACEQATACLATIEGKEPKS